MTSVDNPYLTSFQTPALTSSQPLVARSDSPDEVARRITMLNKAFPEFVDEPESATALASSDLDDVTMMRNASGALSTKAWQDKANSLGRLSSTYQRGMWRNFDEVAQQRLRQAGYEPPDMDDHGSGVLDHLGVVGSGFELVSGAASAVAKPVFHGLDVVLDQPSHMYRAMEDRWGEVHNPLDFARNFTATVGTLTTSPLTMAIWSGPGALYDSWRRTADGEHYITDSAKEDARDQLGHVAAPDDGPSAFGHTADDLLGLATDLAEGSTMEEILQDRDFDPNDAERWRLGYQELETLQQDPAFADALKTLQLGKVSVGRDLARSVGLSEGTTPYNYMSGLSDAAWLLFADPTMVGGKALKARRLAAYGLTVVDGLEVSGNLEKLAENPAVRRAWTTIHDTARAGDWEALGRQRPEWLPMINTFAEHQDQLAHSVQGVEDFFRDGRTLTMMMGGRGEAWRGGAQMVHSTRLNELAADMRQLRHGFVDAGIERGIKAREAVRAGEGSSWAAVKLPGTARTVNLDPYANLANLAGSLGRHVPVHNFLNFSDASLGSELMKFADATAMADVSRTARKAFVNDVLTASNDGQRLQILKSFVDGMFKSLPQDEGVRMLHNRWVDTLDQVYATGGDDIIPNMPGRWGLNLVQDRAHAVAIPDPRELIIAGRQISLWRAVLGSTLNAGTVDRIMSNVWKPSVLLRLGFIPRAAGEEMFAWMLRDPVALPRTQALRSAAYDTPESIAARLSKKMGYQGPAALTADQLHAAYDTAVEHVGWNPRRFPNYHEFINEALQAPDDRVQVLRDIINENHGDELLRFFHLRAETPQALLRPFQLVANITGQFARPWDLEYRQARARLMEAGTREQAATEAAKAHVNATRRSWGFTSPLFRVGHNMVAGASSTGGLATTADMLARHIMFNASQGYRGFLRHYLNPEDIELIRMAASDDVVMHAFAQHMSAGSAGWVDSSRSGPTAAVRTKYGTGTRQAPLGRRGSEFVTQALHPDGEGRLTDIAAHGLFLNVGWKMTDPIIHEAVENTWRRYLAPDMLHELVGTDATAFRFGGELRHEIRVHEAIAADANAQGVLDDMRRFFESLPRTADDKLGPGAEALLHALETANRNDLELARAALHPKFPIPIEAAAEDGLAPVTGARLDTADFVDEFARLSTRTKRFVASYMRDAIDAEEMPALFTDFDRAHTALINEATRLAGDPRFSDDVAASMFANKGAVHGEDVLRPLPKGMTRLYVPMADKGILDNWSALSDQLPEAYRGFARVGAHPNTRVIHPFDDLDVLQRGFAERGDQLVPLGAYATAEPDTARALSKQLQEAMGQTEVTHHIGYIDVPTADARRVTGAGGVVHQLSDTEGNLMAGSYLVNPSTMLTVTHQPFHLAATIGPDGVTGFGGIELEQAHREWAEKAADDFLNTFSNRDKTTILHEMLQPAWEDTRAPMVDAAGRRRFRSTVFDVHAVPGADLPEKTFGPDYFLLPEGGWSKAVRYGFDKVIGPGIDNLVRKPMFFSNWLNAAHEMRPYAELMRDPALWGQGHIDVRYEPRLDLLPDTEQLKALPPATRAVLAEDRHVVGQLHLADPSADMIAAFQQRFPEFNGFVYPGTTWEMDKHGIVFNGQQQNPQLSEWMDYNLELARDHLEHIIDSGGLPEILAADKHVGAATPEQIARAEQLSRDAQVLRDVLSDAGRASEIDDFGNAVHRVNIEMPKVRRYRTVTSRRTATEPGSLHALAQEASGLRLQEMLQSRLSAGVDRHFREIGGRAFGRVGVPQVDGWTFLRNFSTNDGASGMYALGPDIIDHPGFHDAVAETIDALRKHPVTPAERRVLDTIEGIDDFGPLDAQEFRINFFESGANRELDATMHGEYAKVRYAQDLFNDLRDMGTKYLDRGRKMNTTEIIERLHQPQGMTLWRNASHEYLQANPAARPVVAHLRDTLDQTVAEAMRVGDPESLVRAWSELPKWMKHEKTSWRRILDAPEAPAWLKHLGPQALPTLRAGEANAAVTLEHWRQLTTDRAIADSVPFIDSHHVRSQFQEWARNITPFWFAEEQFLKRWGRTIRYTPEALTRGYLMMQGLKHAGMIRTDDQGRDVFVYPGTPMLSNVLGRVIGGIPASERIFGENPSTPLASMMTGEVKYASPGFDRLGIPGISPFLSLPMEMFTNTHPELARLQEQVLGERSVGRGLVRSLVPTSVMRFYDAFDGDSAQLASATNQALQMMAVRDEERRAKGLSPLIPDEDAPEHEIEHWLSDLEGQARVLLLTRAFVGFMAPSSPSVNFVNGAPRGLAENLGATFNGSDLHPELARLMRNLGPEEGLQQFLREHEVAGANGERHPITAWTVFDTTRPSGAPLPATADAAHFYDQHQGWLKAYPYAGAWFLPQPKQAGSPFERRAYYQQLASDMRVRKAPREFLDDLYFNRGSDTYFDSYGAYKSRYAQLKGQDPDSVAARKELDGRWRAWKTGYFAQHPVLAKELTSGVGRERRANVLQEMRVALADPQRPLADHAPAMYEMIRGLDSYNAALDQLYGDRRKQAQVARDDLKARFAEWAESYVLTHPELEPFFRSIIAPTVDPEIFQDGAQS